MTKRSDSEIKIKKIIQAAFEVLTQNGYTSTTINQIAEKAQVSRGLLHYYFKSKEDILVNVVDFSIQLSIDTLDKAFVNINSKYDLAANITQLLKMIINKQPEFFYLFFECWTAARQSQAVAEKLDILYEKFRKSLLDNITEAINKNKLSPASSLPALTYVLTAVLDGIAFQLTINNNKKKKIKDDEFWNSIEKLISKIL